jgi:hypothetical protein
VTSFNDIARPLGRRTAALLAVALLSATALGARASSAHADAVPYRDPAVTGQIALCDQGGHLVTSGRLDAQPFVWRAVSSTPAPAEYAGTGRKATLYAYQPRPDVSADQWSGDQLTATSDYTNPKLPMAQATTDDFTLQTFMGEFRPLVDGLYQLRMYFGIPGQSTLNTAYPATDIRVTGDTWRALEAPNVSCTDGSSRSSELDVIPPLPHAAGSTAAATGRGGAATAPGSRSAPSTSSSSAAGNSKAPSPSGTAGPTRADPSSAEPVLVKAGGTTGVSISLVAIAIAIVLLGAVGGGAWWWRRAHR